MSVHPGTRVAASNRWIRAALAAFVLASGASLLAQGDQKDKDKDKRPAPQHRAAPATTQQTTHTPPSGGQPATHTPPPNPQSSRPPGNPPANPEAVRPGGNQPPEARYGRPTNNPPTNPESVRPSGNPPPNPQYGRPTNNPPANNAPSNRPFGGQPTPNDRPRPTMPNSQPMGRPPVNGANPNGRYEPTRNGPAPSYNRSVYHGANGSEVHFHPDGWPQTVRTHDMTITHTQAGIRHVEYVRPDHSVIVTQGSHYGYVQRPYVVNNVTYVQRTYVVGGVTYAHVYRPYVYNGISLHLYVSSRYYAPAYYGWAYTPWSRPVTFSFGWGGRPWFGFYAGYFSPYPTYASPAYWLTDYMIAMSLQEAYEQQQAAAAAQASAQYDAYPSAQPALTPDVKQAIADEVRRQLDQERMESQSGAPTQGEPHYLADNASHVFVVSTALDVQSANGECSLTEGDVLQMPAPPPDNSAMADLVVLASKGQDCRKSSTVSVAIGDLQEMQNHMRATLDRGLADLQSRQGQGGIPAAPPAATRPPVDAAYAAAAPPPDPNIASEVAQQADSAVQAENEVLDQAQSAPQNSGAPQSVSLGMTIDQVVGILGQPQAIGDLGSKKIYSFSGMKVIFVDGRVSDIQ